MTTLTYTASSNPTRVFEREFLPLLDAVYAFAYRLTGNGAEAEDLVQETYLKAWRFIDRYTEDTNAKAWLFRICQHAFINEWRKRKNQPYKVDYEDIVVFHNDDDPDSNRFDHLGAEIDSDQMGDEITRAINGLTPAFRAVVLLDLEDFTYEEIAVLLELPIGTVRSRLHRARKILAKELSQYGKDQGINVRDCNEIAPIDSIDVPLASTD
ncbi:MAG: sigma-70 family RNA polymerase sigma factor [Saprospiraceae bacterium]|nr:sigma-70 family RNA polymerase sigma factor [Saprospiraceae bacterium]MCB9342913.1 sigma-70 family RNA polymerase sigma factor [Lewinellaceae bacterium]